MIFCASFPTDPPECKVTQQGGEYIGRKNVTYSGFPCQPWRESKESKAVENHLPVFPDVDKIDEIHNFCRNPDGDAAPWCFNGKGEDPEYEYCDVPFCETRETRNEAEKKEYPECRLSEKGKEYVGTKDVTETGMLCVEWSSRAFPRPWDFFNENIAYSEHFLNKDLKLHKNYCRNPGLHRERPWCFVSDVNIQWEYCDIPFCHDPNPPECKLTGKGGEYVGRRNVTISGFACQHWLAKHPTEHEDVAEHLSTFSDEVDGSHNFCRNPDFSGHGPWCYTLGTDFRKNWEYCDVPLCAGKEEKPCDIRVSGKCIVPVECKTDTQGKDYMGKINITKSGLPCQPWMSRTPNYGPTKLEYYTDASALPDDIYPSHNFCRNPEGDPDEPTLGVCGIKCVMQTPPCYAFNFRESDGSCQLVINGRSGLVEANGFGSFVQELCLTEHPNIKNAIATFEKWNGEYPAPAGGKVILRCETAKGFSDGSSLHMATCSSASLDTWCSTFQENEVHCEQDHKYPECKLTKKGREYIGRVNKTESGKECLRWDSQPNGKPDDFFPNVTYDGHFTNLDAWSHKNYCRNPSGKERPWCFVSHQMGVQWEYCDIPMCTDTNPPECKVTQQGGEYIGKKNVTHSGIPCLPWRNLKLENKIIERYLPGLPDVDEIDEIHNFCRNPNGDAAPWCFEGGGENPEYEYCDIPFCKTQEVRIRLEGIVYPECRLTEKGKEYVGTQNATETGKLCIDWASQPFPTPWDFFNENIAYSEHFLNKEMKLHKNYCRNPGLHRERPWCFVSDVDIQWEYCDIPFCHDPNPPECKLTGKGGEYVGRRNVTISGFACQHWLAKHPTEHEDVAEHLSTFSDEVDGSHNFCRNPDFSGHGPWCYTLGTNFRKNWEYCDVPLCPRSDGRQCDIRVSGKCIVPVECKTDTQGKDYMGKMNTTESGLPCQPWMTRTPNDLTDIRDFDYDESAFPGDMYPSHNFCRNPDGDLFGPWCQNAAGTEPSYDYCDIPICL
ncbi:unnamed protein product [Darwinula stevensoni]|uniref:Kringle domain-containing protein n=1 Tax=Darwinula stevensoni TaxID=69355 RepID=A0A7R9FQN0_9CRUS|nr:unnamed protein product [Darwinula stevensoni]CAG0900087.1 unnamed protein product [Darwinula stevensoni]